MDADRGAYVIINQVQCRVCSICSTQRFSVQDIVLLAQLVKDPWYVEYTTNPLQNPTGSVLCFICQTRVHNTLFPSTAGRIPFLACNQHLHRARRRMFPVGV